jgi:type I restriction enzyme S subunit
MSAKMRPLADLCLSTVECVDPRRMPEREFWYVDISAVDSAAKKIVSPQRVRGKEASVRARHVIRTNDVIVATTRPNLNAVALVPPDYDAQICSTGFCVLRPCPEIDPDYLFYFARSPAFVHSLDELTKGALYPAVTDRQVLAQVVPWVPLPQQQSIAARLKAQLAEIDAARQASRAQADDIALLRRRVLAEVFAAVEDAPRKRLGDHAPTTSGSTPPRGVKAYWAPAEVPWVKTGEVAFAPIARTEESVSRRALAECSLTVLPRGSVLVAMYGQGKTRGQSAILKVAATTNQACFAILPNETWEPSFLFCWLMSSYQELRNLSDSRGGNQANLNGALLNALEVPAPSRTQQVAIARRAQDALREVAALAEQNLAQRTELDRLPQRLLAQTFEN